MVTQNAANNKTGASGTVLQGQGVATASDFSTATYPATTGANTVLISTSANVVTTTTYIGATSYTPVLSFGGASTGITYSTQFGKYEQLGNVVTVKINLVLTSKGSSTGIAAITLPVTTASDSATCDMAISCVSTTLPASTNYFLVELGSASTTANIVSFGSNAASAVVDTNFANNSQVRACFSYFV